MEDPNNPIEEGKLDAPVSQKSRIEQGSVVATSHKGHPTAKTIAQKGQEEGRKNQHLGPDGLDIGILDKEAHNSLVEDQDSHKKTPHNSCIHPRSNLRDPLGCGDVLLTQIVAHHGRPTHHQAI